jgi:hypothetical protein
MRKNNKEKGRGKKKISKNNTKKMKERHRKVLVQTGNYDFRKQRKS